MIYTPHLYRVHAEPLGPAKRPPAPIQREEVWLPVDGKPHLEQDSKGRFRTKDFTNEANHPYPAVPDKNTVEPMKPYFDLGIPAGEVIDISVGEDTIAIPVSGVSYSAACGVTASPARRAMDLAKAMDLVKATYLRGPLPVTSGQPDPWLTMAVLVSKNCVENLPRTLTPGRRAWLTSEIKARIMHVRGNFRVGLPLPATPEHRTRMVEQISTQVLLTYAAAHDDEDLANRWNT